MCAGSPGVIAKPQPGGQAEEKWGVFSSTQNVAAVLNDPRKGMKVCTVTRVNFLTLVKSLYSFNKATSIVNFKVS